MILIWCYYLVSHKWVGQIIQAQILNVYFSCSSVTYVTGYGGCPGGIDRRRLWHVLRNLATIWSGRHPVHQVQCPVRLSWCSRATSADPQAQQVQNHQHGHPNLSGRSMLLCRRSRRTDQGLLCAKGKPSWRDCRVGWSDRTCWQTWIRTHFLDLVETTWRLLCQTYSISLEEEQQTAKKVWIQVYIQTRSMKMQFLLNLLKCVKFQFYNY